MPVPSPSTESNSESVAFPEGKADVVEILLKHVLARQGQARVEKITANADKHRVESAQAYKAVSFGTGNVM